MSWYNHWGQVTFEKGIEYFEQAVEKDPAYAVAYAGLADSYGLLGTYEVLPPKEAMTKAEAAAVKALEIDDTLAEAHTSLGWVRTNYDWDWVGAEKEFQRAIELNPNYATAHHWYAIYLRRLGRHDEAIAAIERAQELDPLSLIINSFVGKIYLDARQVDQAIDHLRKTIEMDPNFAPAHRYLAAAFAIQGRYEEAIAEYKKAITLSGGSTRDRAPLAHTNSMSGRRAEAQKVLEELKALSKEKYVSPYAMALIYTGLGEKDLAFEWLEKAYEERSFWLSFLKVAPSLDPLRSDPRFQDLLRRMNFPE